MSSVQSVRPNGPEDWEKRKTIIAKLYLNKDLKEVMNIMETDHRFKATSVASC